MLMDMTAINHLTNKSGYTHELLAALTDTELDEQIEYFMERRNWYRDNPDEVKPESPYRSHAYASYRYSNMAAAAWRVKHDRLQSESNAAS